ncbi:hypothetical protein C4D60_Mb11t00850 [Musa balbisiana]|uniref:Pentacotripeptide-repeat region of PRORP domain-containing protein n=1 Tax=Musa balbisiana TaxID=52838 RepID=A0A4S8J0U8_MUSBA|nr:hypothetical protein C4D60_Mb11t00850 [Musa balbisiana]
MPTRDVLAWTTLVHGLASSGDLVSARRVFDEMPTRDVLAWTTLVHGLASSGDLVSARRVFDEMPTRDVLAWTTLVHGLASSGDLVSARRVFDEMPTRDVLAWTTLVHGLASSGDLVSARRVFDEMPTRDVLAWTTLVHDAGEEFHLLTALIGSYTRHGHPFEALDLFRNMMKLGVAPDQFTFSSALCSCGAIASVKHGKQIHARLLRTRFNPNAIVISSLVDMYSKCGDLAGGQRVFDLTDAGRMDTVLWNTMMSAAGQHGDGIEAVKMFEEMIKTGTKPDANTFIVLLTACSHSGLVEQGLQLFCSMRKQHGVVPDEDHYVCLVDMLGRAGRLEEATECLREMPCGPSARAWNALLGCLGNNPKRLDRISQANWQILVHLMIVTY